MTCLNCHPINKRTHRWKSRPWKIGGGKSGLAPAAGVEGVVKAFFEATNDAAEAVAGCAEDDGAAAALEEVEEVDEELGKGFVFTGLAGKDEEEFAARGCGGWSRGWRGGVGAGSRRGASG